jgi:UDP-2-acetamido-2-deoxy-ribo-hexuluronate aminotransferase
MSIKFVDLVEQYKRYKTEIDQNLQQVLTQANFIFGAQVTEIENTLANYVGVKHAIACGSGTDALQIALMAYGIKPGDEIIMPAYSFIATAEAATLLGAKPVFIDIDPNTWNLDPSKIKEAITDKTKGIIAVNMFGLCADYDVVNAIARAYKLFVIEDGAQSFGAKYKGRMSGALADVGCTSFFPAKILGAYGDGGMVFTDNDEIATLMASIHMHGKGADKYDNVNQGINSRLDTMQAAVLQVKIKHLEEELVLRQQVVATYKEMLTDSVSYQEFSDDYYHVYCNFCIQSNKREELKAKLSEANIPAQVYYVKPLHLQKVYANLGYTPGSLPITENVCNNNLALPMHPFLKNPEIDVIANLITEKCSETSGKL